MSSVADPARGLRDTLDDGVDALEAGVRQTVAQVRQQVRQVALDLARHGRYGREPAMRRPPEPPGEEGARGAGIAVRPEGAEPLLEGPDAGDLEVLALERAEGDALFIRQILGPSQPQVLGAREPRVARPL